MNIVATKRPTVYITEDQAFDYSPAEAFGELVVLKTPQIAPGNIGADRNKLVIASLRTQLATYQPMFDYLLPTGKPSRQLMVGGIMREKGDRHLILGWDQINYRYLTYIGNYET